MGKGQTQLWGTQQGGVSIRPQQEEEEEEEGDMAFKSRCTWMTVTAWARIHTKPRFCG